MVILLVVLLLFGAKKIPELARSLGSGIREFKDATNSMRQELERSVVEEAPPSHAPTTTQEVEPGDPGEKKQEPQNNFEPGSK